jgi:hypothetical protein
MHTSWHTIRFLHVNTEQVLAAPVCLLRCMMVMGSMEWMQAWVEVQRGQAVRPGGALTLHAAR